MMCFDKETYIHHGLASCLLLNRPVDVPVEVLRSHLGTKPVSERNSAGRGIDRKCSADDIRGVKDISNLRWHQSASEGLFRLVQDALDGKRPKVSLSFVRKFGVYIGDVIKLLYICKQIYKL